MRTLLTAITLGLSSPSFANPDLVWRNRFSVDERQALSTWIAEAHAGLERLIGEPLLPFTVQLHRRPGSREPVPWAETRKHRGRTAHFHVDPSYPLAAFRADWTAGHEFVHLLFPYLGDRGRWFAEGVASYLQYPVMVAADALAWDQAVDRLAERLARAASMRGLDDRSVEQLSHRMDGRGATLRVYWGGAAYFLIADQRLHAQTGRRLTDLIGDYVKCCSRLWGQGPEQVIRELDRLSDTRVFSTTRDLTVRRAGFPDTEAALRWLRDQPMPGAGRTG